MAGFKKQPPRHFPVHKNGCLFCMDENPKIKITDGVFLRAYNAMAIGRSPQDDNHGSVRTCPMLNGQMLTQ